MVDGCIYFLPTKLNIFGCQQKLRQGFAGESNQSGTAGHVEPRPCLSLSCYYLCYKAETSGGRVTDGM